MTGPGARTMRSDGRRNRERLLAAARLVVERDGAQASLEEIARRAGVGSATLHRHFPSRRALLDAVIHEGVVGLRDRADELTAADDPAAALATWLEELTVYAVTTGGVVTALLAEPDGRIAEADTCHGLLGDGARVLHARADAAGALCAGATADDLLRLASAIAVAAGPDPDAARRLLRLAVHGVQRPPA